CSKHIVDRAQQRLTELRQGDARAVSREHDLHVLEHPFLSPSRFQERDAGEQIDNGAIERPLMFLCSRLDHLENIWRQPQVNRMRLSGSSPLFPWWGHRFYSCGTKRYGLILV